jgi:hypothetical protein
MTVGDNLTKTGKGMWVCGCVSILLPVFIIVVLMLFAIAIK